MQLSNVAIEEHKQQLDTFTLQAQSIPTLTDKVYQLEGIKVKLNEKLELDKKPERFCHQETRVQRDLNQISGA